MVEETNKKKKKWQIKLNVCKTSKLIKVKQEFDKKKKRRRNSIKQVEKMIYL